MLPDEGDIVNETLPKYNFAKEDLDATLLTLWTCKDLRYISERDRVEFTFLLHVYCWTGARIGAFFNGKGLRYKVWLRIVPAHHLLTFICRTFTLFKDDVPIAIAMSSFGRLINDGLRIIAIQIQWCMVIAYGYCDYANW